MKARNIGLIFSGSIILLIGLAHTIFPAYGYSKDVQEYFKQSPQIADHFYYLATYAICSFLLFIGLITVYIGTSNTLANHNSKFIRYYSILSIVVWSGRLILEIKYPVKLSLFGIHEPTKNLIIVLSLIVIGFIAGLFKSFTMRLNKS